MDVDKINKISRFKSQWHKHTLASAEAGVANKAIKVSTTPVESYSFDPGSANYLFETNNRTPKSWRTAAIAINPFLLILNAPPITKHGR